jgi:hypothetical protein
MSDFSTPDDSAVAQSARLLELAQKLHDELINSATVEAAKLREDAQVDYDSLTTEARVFHESMVSEAEQKASQITHEAEDRAEALILKAEAKAIAITVESEGKNVALNTSILKLQSFEAEYRNNLRKLVESAATTLGLHESIEDEINTEDYESQESISEDAFLTKSEIVDDLVIDAANATSYVSFSEASASIPDEKEVEDNFESTDFSTLNLDDDAENSNTSNAILIEKTLDKEYPNTVDVRDLISDSMKFESDEIIVGEVIDSETRSLTESLEKTEDEETAENESKETDENK